MKVFRSEFVFQDKRFFSDMPEEQLNKSVDWLSARLAFDINTFSRMTGLTLVETEQLLTNPDLIKYNKDNWLTVFGWYHRDHGLIEEVVK